VSPGKGIMNAKALGIANLGNAEMRIFNYQGSKEPL
jgi:hypothetical protein